MSLSNLRPKKYELKSGPSAAFTQLKSPPFSTEMPVLFASKICRFVKCFWSRLEITEKLLKRRGNVRGKTKVPTKFLFSKINASKHGKIDKWRIGLHVIWQTTKNGQHLKGLAF